MCAVMRVILFLLFSCCLFFSCAEKETGMIIYADCSEADVVSLSSCKKMQLQFNVCDSVIGAISQVVIQDSVLLLKTTGGLFSLNIDTGKQIARYSRLGRAENEYLSLWSVGFINDNVYIYDMNAKKIKLFERDGSFVTNIDVPSSAASSPFQQFVRSGDYYIGKRVFTSEKISELSVYDNNFNYLMDIGEIALRSGFSLGYPFYKKKDGTILYYRGMLNDIYQISGNKVSKRYTVNFGRQNIPGLKRFKEELEIINYANNAPDKYATGITNIYESEKYFGCMFLMYAQKCYLLYDVTNNSSVVLKFESDTGVYIEQIIMYGDQLMIFTQDESGGVCLYLIPMSNRYGTDY